MDSNLSGSSALSERVRSLRLKEASAHSAPRGTWLPWALCLLFAGAAGVMGYFAFGKLDSEGSKSSAEVSTVAPETGSAGQSHQAVASGDVVVERKGYIIPAHQILVSPKVSGMIEKLDIEEGVRVQKGQILAVLETTDYKADYDHTLANVNSAWQRFVELYTGSRPQEIRQAKAEWEEMEAQTKQLYLDWKRNTRLQTNSALAARDYEQAESQYRAMEKRTEKMRQAYELMLEGPRLERIEGAWADLEQAEADLVKSKWRLDNCTIRAPISGTILTKKAEIGNLVNPIAFNGSFSLCEMADLADIEVDLSIEEREIAKVFKDQKCRIRPEAFPERVYQGYVSRLMPTADRAKSAISVRVKLSVPKEEEGVYLKPDMGAVVSFLRKADK